MGIHEALLGASVSGMLRPLMKKYRAVLVLALYARFFSTALWKSGSIWDST